jgi:hypothetical protein
MKTNRPGLARRALGDAQALDEQQRDYLGLGKTQEMLGDLYAPKPRNRNAAEDAYAEAKDNFKRANDARRAEVVERKLRDLTGVTKPPPDGWLTRALDRCARALVKAVERRRARARKKED